MSPPTRTRPSWRSSTPSTRTSTCRKSWRVASMRTARAGNCTARSAIRSRDAPGSVRSMKPMQPPRRPTSNAGAIPPPSRVTAPAGATQTLAWARRSGPTSATRQVGDRVPVAFIEDVVAGIIEGFFFRGTAHHRARGPDLELPSELLAAKRTLGADAGSRLVIGVLSNAGEHHVRVLRRKPGAGGRAAGVHDRREGFLDGLGLVEALDDVKEAALVIEFVFGDPEPAHDLQPLGGIVV